MYTGNISELNIPLDFLTKFVYNVGKAYILGVFLLQFFLDIHCHTTASGHASNSIEQMLERANDIGLKLCGISDHGPAMPGSCPLSYFADLLKLPNYIKIPWLKGVEANIIDTTGKTDMPDNILRQLDYSIASIHGSLATFPPGNAALNTAAVIGAMQNPYINIIGHLGDPHVPIFVQPIITAAKETGTIIEINNKSLKPGHRRNDGGAVIKEIITMCKTHGVAVIAGSDAHSAKEVGQLKYAKALIKKSGISEDLVMNTNVNRFLNTLKGKRKNE